MSPPDSLFTSLLALLCCAVLCFAFLCFTHHLPPSPSHASAPPVSPSLTHKHMHTCTHSNIIEKSRSLLAEMCTVACSIDVYSAPALAKTPEMMIQLKFGQVGTKIVKWNLNACFFMNACCFKVQVKYLDYLRQCIGVPPES